jgi:hypothetical protein
MYQEKTDILWYVEEEMRVDEIGSFPSQGGGI